jgi:hypothetical protein
MHTTQQWEIVDADGRRGEITRTREGDDTGKTLALIISGSWNDDMSLMNEREITRLMTRNRLGGA